MSNQGYFEPTDIRTRKAPEHQKNAIRIKGSDLSNSNIVPIVTVQKPASKYKPVGYWTDETIISELEPIIEKLGHFPSRIELRKMKRNDLAGAMTQYGGPLKFQELLGYEPKRKHRGYWTDETIESELKPIIKELGHFPSQTELKKMNKKDLLRAISRRGGFLKLQELLGYEAKIKPNDYWTDETIISDLKPIIEELGHFPIQNELIKMKRNDLSSAISKNGGFPKLQEMLGYEVLKKPVGYWTDETIESELEPIIEELGHFPLQTEIVKKKKGDLLDAINQHGGLIKFQEMLGYEAKYKPVGYWTDETIESELEPIIEELGHFPSQIELTKMKRNDLLGAIAQQGGILKFQELLGFNVSLRNKYKSEINSYIGKRGRKSEYIVKQIIDDWLEINGFPEVSCNVKLAPKNVLEFVCTMDKTIGIDVTNTNGKDTVAKKWRKKDYYKNLDEFWIVVFSNTFTDRDYDKWNCESPENVRVMSIDMFLENLDYSIGGNLQTKIDKYKGCTFWTKEQYLSKPISDFI